jgi:hypothetical protein
MLKRKGSERVCIVGGGIRLLQAVTICFYGREPSPDEILPAE